jgi:transposase
MLIQQIAPVAKTEFASIFVALELSRSKWLVGVGAPQRWTVRRHEVLGGDLDGLLELLRRISAGEEKRTGLPARVHVCFEAGRDGHWLHRALTSAGYDVYEIDPASVAVDRRARRAKSDGVDVDKLVRTLARLLRGELDACRVVAVPSEAEEDAKRPHREYERLVKEQTAHRNRAISTRWRRIDGSAWRLCRSCRG